MELRTCSPFWLMRSGYINTYPSMQSNAATDVLVIGAGITGSLTAHMLAQAGIDTLVVDRGHPGMGSTSASTALLQYEIDEPLHSLRDKVGGRRADDAYLACHLAVDSLAAMVADAGIETDMEAVPSLQYASYAKDVPGLRKELAARRGLGLDVSWLDPDDLENCYGFRAPAAILSSKGGTVDPFVLAHGLLARSNETMRVYDCSCVAGLESTRNGVTALLENGRRIKARRAVVACGFQARQFLPRPVVDMGSTYALATKPLPSGAPMPENTLVWETKTPYIYVRATADGRIVAGGRDDRAGPRDRESRLRAKTGKLLADLNGLFPDAPLIVDFAWGAAFGSTRDSLGYVGPVKGEPRILFNLGYGGNGILYSYIGAEIIRDTVLGKRHRFAETFSFDR